MKQKRFFLPIIAVCIMLISFIGCTISYILTPSDTDTPDDTYIDEPAVPPGEPGEPPFDVITTFERGEFRAVWVATVLNLDFPINTNLSAAALKWHIDAIIANTVDMGLNTVIFQARPAGDAFYASDIFPWSAWLSGQQGVGIDGFDPLAYWIEACHANNLELHAWLNPYRIIHTRDNSSDPNTLAPNNPVRQNPELAVAWSASATQKGLFLDPGLPEARKLIIDGITELISNYDVDGIHFDDYFYPGTDFNDAGTFELYGLDMELDDWRRENVNTLIRDIQTVIRDHNSATGKSVAWGISPSAIWKNGSEQEPLGIPTTKGQQSYHALYADTRRWVEEEWVDYICPQIYWYIGYDIANFEAIFNWWDELCANNSVELYIGHAAYREQAGDQAPHWEGEIIRQLEMVAASETVQGSVFFRYESLLDGLGQAIGEFYAEKDDTPIRNPLLICDTLSVGFPERDASISANKSNAPGYNIVGTSIPDIPLYINGEEVTNRTPEGFFHVFPPLSSGDNVFTFTQAGQDDVTRVITLKSPGGGSNNPRPAVTNVTALDYATVKSNEAWVYSDNSTNDGIGYMLTPGQVDRVVAKSGTNLVKLSGGVWIRSDAVTIQREDSVIEDVLSSGVYRTGTDFDYVVWSGDVFPAAVASYDGSKLSVKFGLHKAPPELELPENLGSTLFSAARSGVAGGVPYWEFTVKDDAKLEGFYIDYENSEFRLCLKKRKSLAGIDKPLTGIKIVLDAGHGGDAPGTTAGPFGGNLPEKEITLTNTLKLSERLTALGAEVILTRDADTDLSLQERVNISRETMPDIFISLHVNSNAETTNWINIRGFTVWHQNAGSLPLAETAADVMRFVNPATNRTKIVNQANFYVCRPWWSPHILFESSYISNINDYVWLLNETQQDRYAQAAVDMVLDYFS